MLIVLRAWVLRIWICLEDLLKRNECGNNFGTTEVTHDAKSATNGSMEHLIIFLGVRVVIGTK